MVGWRISVFKVKGLALRQPVWSVLCVALGDEARKKDGNLSMRPACTQPQSCTHRSEGYVLLPNLWTVLLDSAGWKTAGTPVRPREILDMSFNKG